MDKIFSRYRGKQASQFIRMLKSFIEVRATISVNRALFSPAFSVMQALVSSLFRYESRQNED